MRYLHETFAEMLLDGETYQLEPDPVTEAGGSCLLYTSPSPRDGLLSRMPSSA